MVGARDNIYRMKDLKGKKIGLTKSLNTIKNDFDVHEWAALEFLEQATKELLEEQWQKVISTKLPTMSTLRLG